MNEPLVNALLSLIALGDYSAASAYFLDHLKNVRPPPLEVEEVLRGFIREAEATGDPTYIALADVTNITFLDYLRESSWQSHNPEFAVAPFDNPRATVRHLIRLHRDKEDKIVQIWDHIANQNSLRGSFHGSDWVIYPFVFGYSVLYATGKTTKRRVKSKRRFSMLYPKFEGEKMDFYAAYIGDGYCVGVRSSEPSAVSAAKSSCEEGDEWEVATIHGTRPMYEYAKNQLNFRDGYELQQDLSPWLARHIVRGIKR